jgi:predicted Rossmann fold flavoprotein
VSNSSQSVIDCLLREAEQYKVVIQTNTDVSAIQHNNNQFELIIKKENGGEQRLTADLLVVATGGHPKLSGFDWLAALGHTVSVPVPSLFTFNIPDKRLHELMGIAVKQAVVKIPVLKAAEEGPVLITHWGLSGPAILKLSSRCARELHELDYTFDVVVNWFPEYHESAALDYLKSAKQFTKGLVSTKPLMGLVSRLWIYLLNRSGIDAAIHWGELTHVQMVALSKTLCNDVYQAKGKTTFKEEFVTAGGISLQEIDANTMESKKIKGLYFAGEVMDVDGITGGYNFQHAWTSGWIVANSIT